MKEKNQYNFRGKLGEVFFVCDLEAEKGNKHNMVETTKLNINIF